MNKKKDWQDVLCFSDKPPARETVHKFYKIWRLENILKICCDNVDCRFNHEQLIWNGRELKPILDHINGQRNDNSPSNLRYLFPNCDSQLDTRGGGNKGRIHNKSRFGYEIFDKKSKTRSAHVFPEGVSFRLSSSVTNKSESDHE